MKPLVVFYSKTGRTKKVAEAVSKILNCDSEEIFDRSYRKGIIGFFSGGMDASRKKTTKIIETKRNPSRYDIVIIGTPIWASAMSPAIRTYLSQNKNFKKVAFFCTEGSDGGLKAFKEMEELCRKKPVALLELRTKEVLGEEYDGKLKEFIVKIRGS